MKALIDFDAVPVFAIPTKYGRAREGMLIEGPQGWGEFSPAHDCDDHVLARWLTAAVEPGTVGWPDPVRGRVPIAVTVPSVDAALAHRIAADAGCRTAQVRVAARAGSLADDLARVEAVRDALGGGGLIRCDAGGSWDVDTAVSAIPALEKAAGGLEYVEQPCRTLEELAEVRRKAGVRVAADESICHAKYPHRVSLAEAADVAVLSCGPLGGVRRALRVAELCGLPCVVSSDVQTSIGLAAGVALAGALPELPFACGLGTRSLLDGDLVNQARSLIAVNGHLPVAPMAASPDPGLVAQFALTDRDRADRWRERLGRARAAA